MRGHVLPYFTVILREYHIHSGKTEMTACLKRQFPGEEEAIDEFMKLMKVGREVTEITMERWDVEEGMG